MVQYKWVALSTAVAYTGAPTQIAASFGHTPASGTLFAEFLGYTPIITLLHVMGPTVVASLPQNALNILTGQAFFPNVIASPFIIALTEAFIFVAVLCFLTAVFLALRGKESVCKENRIVRNAMSETTSE